MRLNLINARKKQGYTQFELSNELGITERQYQRLEAGTSKGSVTVWENLKQLLHAKTIDYLLEQVDDTHNLSCKPSCKASCTLSCNVSCKVPCKVSCKVFDKVFIL